MTENKNKTDSITRTPNTPNSTISIIEISLKFVFVFKVISAKFVNTNFDTHNLILYFLFFG